MTYDLPAPAVELLDSRLDHRWIWSAMPAAERRLLLDRMVPWVDWLVGEYTDQLAAKVPVCWFRHTTGRNELTALYVAFIRTYVEPGENQRETALVEFHDALARVAGRLNFPTECLENGEHTEPLTERKPWKTYPQYLAWATTAPEMAGPVDHPAPYYQQRPKLKAGQQQAPPRSPLGEPAPAPAVGLPAPAPEEPPAPRVSPLLAHLPLSLGASEMDRLVTEGTARRFGETGAIRHCEVWWINPDGLTWVRLQPDLPDHAPIIRDLDAALTTTV